MADSMTFARTDLNFSCNKLSNIKSITTPSLGNSFTGRGGMLTGVAGYMLPGNFLVSHADPEYKLDTIRRCQQTEMNRIFF